MLIPAFIAQPPVAQPPLSSADNVAVVASPEDPSASPVEPNLPSAEVVPEVAPAAPLTDHAYTITGAAYGGPF